MPPPHQRGQTPVTQQQRGSDPRYIRAVARWAEIEREVPELATRARGFLEAHTHRTIATLRKDGSPRISGIECEFVDGDLRFGSMWHGVKALDLLRDPRFALHSGSGDPPEWPGDAQVAGNAAAPGAQTECL